MSEVITLTTSQSETIHGGYQAAKDYVAMMFGSTYDAWTALASDDLKKRTLAAAVRYFNSLTWATAYNTFALRDVIPAFAPAEYELAVLICDDASVLAATDSGSNVKTLGAGSARIEFWRPSSTLDGNATVLPTVVDRLVGQYLASAAGFGVGGVATGITTPCDDNDDGGSLFGDDSQRDLTWPL